MKNRLNEIHEEKIQELTAENARLRFDAECWRYTKAHPLSAVEIKYNFKTIESAVRLAAGEVK